MEIFQKNNSVTGTVIGGNNYGCYVRDDESGRVVFYYGNGMKGDRVQLTIYNVDLKRERVTCKLDSVLEYGNFVA